MAQNETVAPAARRWRAAAELLEILSAATLAIALVLVVPHWSTRGSLIVGLGVLAWLMLGGAVACRVFHPVVDDARGENRATDKTSSSTQPAETRAGVPPAIDGSVAAAS